MTPSPILVFVLKEGGGNIFKKIQIPCTIRIVQRNLVYSTVTLRYVQYSM